MTGLDVLTGPVSLVVIGASWTVVGILWKALNTERTGRSADQKQIMDFIASAALADAKMASALENLGRQVSDLTRATELQNVTFSTVMTMLTGNAGRK